MVASRALPAPSKPILRIVAEPSGREIAATTGHSTLATGYGEPFFIHFEQDIVAFDRDRRVERDIERTRVLAPKRAPENAQTAAVVGLA